MLELLAAAAAEEFEAQVFGGFWSRRGLLQLVNNLESGPKNYLIVYVIHEDFFEVFRGKKKGGRVTLPPAENSKRSCNMHTYNS